MLNVSKKINLLADNGLLALKWTQQIFDEVVTTLCEFGQISNLYINENKSMIVPVGPGAHNRKRLDGSDSFQYFTGGSFHYLGIDWNRNGVLVNSDCNYKLEMDTIT